MRLLTALQTSCWIPLTPKVPFAPEAWYIILQDVTALSSKNPLFSIVRFCFSSTI